MADIIERFDVGEIYIPHVKREKIPTAVYYDKFLDAVNRKRVKLSEVSAGESFTVGDGHCTVVAPCSDDYEGLNDYSIGILMRHGKKSFLFTGDAEEASETEMILSGRLSSVDVYKAGHHGSSSSSTEGFLAVIRPEYAVISCGRDNPYGHPSDQVIKRLQRYTKNIFRTDLCGDIIICSDGEEISVRTERDEII
jgi:competence protein ComEC